MADQISFYLDENIPASVAEQLRKHNIEVVRCQDLGMRTATDQDHLTLASKENRVLVTLDSDFLRLNSEGKVHSGIAFITGPKNVGVIVKGLLDLHESRLPDQMVNRVSYI